MFFINCFSIVFVFFSHLSWSLCIFCHHIHLISCSPWRYMASSKPLHLRGEDKDKGYVPAAAGTVVFWSNDSAGDKLMSSEVKATNVAKWCLMIFFCMPWQMPTHPALFMASGWTGWRISWWYENLVTCRRNLVQSIWLQRDQSQSERRQLKPFPVLTRVFAQRVLFEAVWSWQTTYLVHSCVVWSQGRDVWLSNLEGCRVILLDRCLAQHPNSMDLEAWYQ